MPNFACRRSTVVCLLLMTIVSFCMGYAQSLPSVHAAATPKVTSASKLVASPTSAAVGALVTLTATVQSSAGQPLTVGSVAFYNGTVLLGSSQVIGTTSGGGVVGTAVWRTRSLPVGADSLTAVYSGPDGASTSAAVKVAIAGAYPSATSLAAAGVQGSYALTGTVLGEGPFTPTGSVLFTDNQTNTKLGTVALDPTTLLQGFVTGSTPNVGSNPVYSAVGDVNGDGTPDIVEALNDQAILVLIGNGDGTFKAPQTVDGNVGIYYQLALGDFNGDGRPDIAAVAYTSIGYAVNIYLGNGNGTFAAAVPYSVVNGYQLLCVGDFNGDGKLDIAVGGTGSNPDEIGILIGNRGGSGKLNTGEGGGSRLNCPKMA